MKLKKRELPKRRCVVCDRLFKPKDPRRIYCNPRKCGQKAYRFRVADKLAELARMKHQQEANRHEPT